MPSEAELMQVLSDGGWEELRWRERIRLGLMAWTVRLFEAVAGE